jgi:PAT family beta-lactamase induction signal transducer AmpG
MRPVSTHRTGRAAALVVGLVASAAILLASATAMLLFGWLLLHAAAAVGISGKTDITAPILGAALLPFLALAAVLPRIDRMPRERVAQLPALIAPYFDILRRFGYGTLPLLAFVSFYRMGDVMTLTLSHPLWNARGYALRQIAIADGAIALVSIVVGVALGGWIAARMRLGIALALGALGSAIGNWVFVWLWRTKPSSLALYLSAGIDQLAHGLESAIFVVYLSMLVNPRYPVAQYAFLSGLALLLPRLVAGASGAIQLRIGWDGFFLLSGGLSAGAILFLPLITRVRPRPDGG